MGRYDDIINLPHHESKVHKKMSLTDRAAQFSPFAALTGYEEKIEETARLTSGRAELTEDSLDELDMQLSAFLAGEEGDAEVSLTYFRPDLTKQGGAYVSKQGKIKKVDRLERVIVFEDGESVDLDEVLSIDFVR